MSGIHPTASAGFSKAADAYERGRPDYPSAAIEWLARRLDLRPGVTAVDLAAGTGKLTRALLPTGAAVVAVEPVAEMRALIEGAEALDGRAEAMPFPEEWADAVVVGQAFHWFANDDALAEIHRVLKPGGALGLIWNGRVADDPVQAQIDRLVEPLLGDATPYFDDSWRRVLERSALFGPIEEARFDHGQEVDEQGLVDRVLSTSYVAAAPDAVRRELEARLRELAAGGRVRLPYVTQVFATGKVEPRG
jgi:SAM-dependent methyltransferase